MANEYVGAPEPFYYDVVDVTRQQYQNLFAEALRVFGAHIRECIPFGREFAVMKDSNVHESTIKQVVCKDEQGHNRRCTIDELKEECLKVPNCAGFNSNGYLKSYIRKGETTHIETSPANMLSLIASLTPFSDFNQSPRNMYQCQVSVRAAGDG